MPSRSAPDLLSFSVNLLVVLLLVGGTLAVASSPRRAELMFERSVPAPQADGHESDDGPVLRPLPALDPDKRPPACRSSTQIPTRCTFAPIVASPPRAQFVTQELTCAGPPQTLRIECGISHGTSRADAATERSSERREGGKGCPGEDGACAKEGAHLRDGGKERDRDDGDDHRDDERKGRGERSEDGRRKDRS